MHPLRHPGLAAGPSLQPDHHATPVGELLWLAVLDPALAQSIAHRPQIHRLGELHLDRGPAREVDPHVGRPAGDLDQCHDPREHQDS